MASKDMTSYDSRVEIDSDTLKIEPVNDTCNLTYIAFLFIGISILFPYNAFVFLVDFYRERFCELNLLYWGMIFIVLFTTLISASITNLLADRVSFAVRINFGFILFAIALIFFLIFDVLIEMDLFNNSPQQIGYVTFISAAFAGSANGVQQPSFYGMAGMLPRRYTQAIIIGETVSGIFASIFRIATKLLHDPKNCHYYDTIIYILITMVIVIIGFCLWLFIYYSSFTNYWFKKTQAFFSIAYHIVEEVEQECPETQETNEGESVITGRPPSSRKNEDDRKPLVDKNSFVYNEPLTKSDHFQLDTKGFIVRRIEIVKKIWAQMLTLIITFVITLLIFPTFIVSAYPCNFILCDWTPIISLSLFAFSDFVVRWFTLIKVRWNKYVTLLLASLRVIFIPLILIFILPVGNPIVPVQYGIPLMLAVVCVFAVTNGYLGSIPLIQIPTLLRDADKELGGTMGIFTLLVGLTLGSLLAFPFNYLEVLTGHVNITLLYPCCISHISNNISESACDNCTFLAW